MTCKHFDCVAPATRTIGWRSGVVPSLPEVVASYCDTHADLIIDGDYGAFVGGHDLPHLPEEGDHA